MALTGHPLSCSNEGFYTSITHHQEFLDESACGNEMAHQYVLYLDQLFILNLSLYHVHRIGTWQKLALKSFLLNVGERLSISRK